MQEVAKDLKSLLKEVYGFDDFRSRQLEVINRIMSGQDTLVIMPTGGGKSLCYQLPAIAKNGTALVVSPLISLMNNQVQALRENGVAAAALHSGISEEERRATFQQIDSGTLKLLYVSPEKISSQGFVSYLKAINISLVAIDEAHCVSVWGNDFRPDYIALKVLKQELPNVPAIALTATADENTRKDIVKQLQLKDADTFVDSFERKNITITVEEGRKRIEKIHSLLQNHLGETGIIYCLSRKDTENVASKLQNLGYTALHYHAGMEAAERKEVEQKFQNDDIQIICATIAFGMGIDKPNIRFVMHYNMPKNIESYYQEIGRAGRDGKDAHAYTFYSYGDFMQLKDFIERGQATEEFKNIQRQKLQRIWEFVTSADCRTNLILNYFDEFRHEGCEHCDNCLNPPEKQNRTREALMIASAVKRSGERLGMEMIIDILRGSQRREIVQQGLDQIKTFGVGRETSRNNWKYYIIQLVNIGILKFDYSDGSSVKWTSLTPTLIKGGIDVELAALTYSSPKEKTPSRNQERIDLSSENQGLFDQLKKWRLKIATAKESPAYTIMHNRTLEEIAERKPKSKGELLQIYGIGTNKFNLYGEELLEICKNN